MEMKKYGLSKKLGFYRKLRQFLFSGINVYMIASISVSMLVFAACKPKQGPGTQYYTVTFSVEGGNGALAARIGEKDITKSPLSGLSNGTKIEFTATPNKGYTVQHWKINGKTQDSAGKERNYNHVVNGSAAITVQFVKSSEEDTQDPSSLKTVTMQPVEYGRLTVSPELKNGKARENTELTFTAEPNLGYTVDTWNLPSDLVTAGGKQGDTSATITLKKDVTVGVSFKLKTFTVTYTVAKNSPDLTLTARYEGDSTILSSPVTVTYGKKIVFETKSTAAGDDKEVEWKITGSTEQNGGKQGDTAATVTITDTTSVTVEHTPISAQSILNKTQFKVPKETTKDFSLLASTSAGYPLQWESSDTDTIAIQTAAGSSPQAVVTRDIVAKTVTLTATLHHNGQTATRSFSIIVKPIEKIEMKPAAASGKPTFIYTLTTDAQGKTVLEVLRDNNGAKEGARYAVTVDPLKKTVKARLTAEYSNSTGNQWKTLETAEKETETRIQQDSSLSETEKKKESAKSKAFYAFRARPVCYSYALKKENGDSYRITITSKYNSGQPWYEQKGAYSASSSDFTISVDESQAPQKVLIKYKGTDYDWVPSGDGRMFTATENNGAETITVTVNEENTNGVLRVAIGSDAYQITFTPQAMQ